LIQGIGNPSRGDDALGPTVIAELGEGDFTSEWQYQLQVEHAEQWSHYDTVILIDAHANLHKSFEWKELTPSDMELSISSHQLAPETVLAMNRAYFQNHPRVFLLALKSQSFDLGAPLTPIAEEALKAGLTYLKTLLA
jgi:hydrogenase maturation protease